jgi:hypothetical protein
MDPSTLVLSVFVSGQITLSLLIQNSVLPSLPLREKELLLATLDFLEEHENQSLSGEVPFQLEIKVRLHHQRVDLRLYSAKREKKLTSERLNIRNSWKRWSEGFPPLSHLFIDSSTCFREKTTCHCSC